jgi:hypothetical protein
MDSEEFVNLSLDGGEEEGFEFEFDEAGEDVGDLRWCLAGRFLGDKIIHANSMMARMADLWRPVRGVSIKEAKAGLFLFCFNHQFDMEEVMKNGPWTFDNQLLIMERVQIGVQIENIPLFHADFWVQIHDLPTGLMKETVGTQLGNYIGVFMEYDKNNNSCFWRQYMRLRVKMDVRVPLKKVTKVKDRNGNWCTVRFKYEKLGIFCFVCGIMGHAENRCETRFAMEVDDGKREWSNELRADSRKVAGRPKSRWLVEERGGGPTSWGRGDGANNGPRQSAGESSMQGPNKINVPNESVNSIIIANQNSQNIPIKTCPNPVGQLSNTKEPQSLPNNTLNVSIPIVTGGTTSVIKPAVNQHLFPPIATFNASAKSTYQPSTSTTKHVRPATSHVKRVSSSVQSLANHFQTLSQPLHVSQPIMTPIIFTDPTHKNKYSLPNHTMPTQPSCRKLIDHELPSMQAIPAPQIPIVTPENNVSVPFPVTVTDDSEGVENMEVQVERKRRREEEIKKCSTNGDINQHFLSAGPGSQDCREQ